MRIIVCLLFSFISFIAYSQCPPEQVGTACDDNNPQSINDAYDADCNCVGIEYCGGIYHSSVNAKNGFNLNIFNGNCFVVYGNAPCEPILGQQFSSIQLQAGQTYGMGLSLLACNCFDGLYCEFETFHSISFWADLDQDGVFQEEENFFNSQGNDYAASWYSFGGGISLNIPEDQPAGMFLMRAMYYFDDGSGEIPDPCLEAATVVNFVVEIVDSLDSQNCQSTCNCVGCTDPCDSNYDPIATENDDTLCAGDANVNCGCTDPAACNYSPEALYNDFNCDYGISECDLPCEDQYEFSIVIQSDYDDDMYFNLTNLENEVVYLSGTPNDVEFTDFGIFLLNDEIYSCDLIPGCYEISASLNGIGSGNFSFSNSEGTLSSGNFSFSPEQNSYSNTFCFGVTETPGCSDVDACNFDPEATINDLSCIYEISCPNDPCLNSGNIYEWDASTCDCILTETVAIVYGCADQEACNFNPLADCDDASCVYTATCDLDPCDNGMAYVWDENLCECVIDLTIEIVYGCADPDACNFDPSADCEDPSSCIYIMECDSDLCTNGGIYEWDENSCQCELLTATSPGCADQNAVNYDPLAICFENCIYNPDCTPGTPCDDGNPASINDLYDENCVCQGTEYCGEDVYFSYEYPEANTAYSIELSGPNCTSTIFSNGNCIFPNGLVANSITPVLSGESYTMEIQLTDCLVPITEELHYGERSMAIWLDLNQDGLFDNDSELLLFLNNFDYLSTSTVSITIPAGAPLGLTGMRYRYATNTNNLLPNPCDVAPSGGQYSDGGTLHTFFVEVVDESNIEACALDCSCTGCTDPCDSNFDPYALVNDDTMCAGDNLCGCMDPNSCNFDANAVYTDFSCLQNVNCELPCEGSYNLAVEIGYFVEYYIVDLNTDEILYYGLPSEFSNFSICDLEACYALVVTSSDETYFSWDLTDQNGMNISNGFEELSPNETRYIDIGNCTCLGPNAEIDDCGCTDALACNYDSEVNNDDGSCIYETACQTIPTCENDGNVFAWNAGTCECQLVMVVDFIFGCNDPNAINFSGMGVCDDGSCVYGGCPANVTETIQFNDPPQSSQDCDGNTYLESLGMHPSNSLLEINNLIPGETYCFRNDQNYLISVYSDPNLESINGDIAYVCVTTEWPTLYIQTNELDDCDASSVDNQSLIEMECISCLGGICGTSCFDVFTDSGGVIGTYEDEENETYVICPDDFETLTIVEFHSFNTRIGLDQMYIYDGPDTNSPLILTSNGDPYWEWDSSMNEAMGTGNPVEEGPFVSSHPTGCLTFVWSSGTGTSNGEGWTALIACLPSYSGCLDPCYVNFDPYASISDPSLCFGESRCGCTDMDACNYDPQAIEEDGSCILETACDNIPTCENEGNVFEWNDEACECVQTLFVDLILGCTDPEAINYNPMNSCDDGSCIYGGFASTIYMDNDNSGDFTEGDEPIAGAIVLFEGPDGFVFTSVSDQMGLIETGNLPLGNYTITIYLPAGIQFSDGSSQISFESSLGEDGEITDFGSSSDGGSIPINGEMENPCEGFSAFAEAVCLADGSYFLVINTLPSSGNNVFGVIDNNSGNSTESMGGIVVLEGFLDQTGYDINVYLLNDPSCSINLVQSQINCTTTEISLLRFNGTVEQNGNQLVWQTASENNSDYFLLERSVDGQIFESIGSRISTQGNSNINNGYEYLDKEIESGVYYYRLTEYDKEGKANVINKIVRLERAAVSFANLIISPIPTSQFLNIQFDSEIDGTVQMKTYDLTGKQISLQSQNVDQGFNSLKLTVGKYPVGTYFIQLMMDGEMKVERFVVK